MIKRFWDTAAILVAFYGTYELAYSVQPSGAYAIDGLQPYSMGVIVQHNFELGLNLIFFALGMQLLGIWAGSGRRGLGKLVLFGKRLMTLSQERARKMRSQERE
jgi:hypothetical protein